jgi:coenzyme F420-dependent glucose-6-phosphate dehydrogenase
MLMSSHSILGFHCSHEQFAPSVLLRHLKVAADAGFQAAMCSDHFHPWSERQGHSGFAWSWLGAALERTSLSLGTVCAPGQRYHPAIIAQAAATLAEMYPARLWLAVGSGEALNEAITGARWPVKSERHDRLKQCVDVMRALWAGETVTTSGPVTTEAARLYSRPVRPPRLLGAALSPDTARWVATWADGLITVAGQRDEMRAVIDAFHEGGGEGKPMFLQVTLSYAPTDSEAILTAYHQWRHCALPTTQLADLVTPADFDRASESTEPAEVLAKVRASSDIGRHAAWLEDDRELGFERIYLHNVARAHQERFIDACGSHLLPALTSR